MIQMLHFESPEGQPRETGEVISPPLPAQSDKNECTERGKRGQGIYRLDKNSVPSCPYDKYRE